MTTRRGLLRLIGATAGACALGPMATAASFVSRRPPAARRKFVSRAVEAEILRVKAAIGDPELAWLFENCYPNTLDSTVRFGKAAGKPDSFIITGDIAAMWLRDSSAQLWPYLKLVRQDDDLRRLFQGAIARQARCIGLDPYANAFLFDARATRPLPWAQKDLTEHRPGVGERKWEIDSLCYPIRLAYGYWRATDDTAPFDTAWWAAMRLVLAVFQAQQRKEDAGPYHFQRRAETPTETQFLGGYGNPTRKIGLINSMFRPSDDACLYPFSIPGNLFAALSLKQLAEMADSLGAQDDFAARCRALSTEIEAAVRSFGLVRAGQGEAVLAYEIDGFGNQLFMDDANIPSLLSLPYLGCLDRQDPLYRSTRQAVWSLRNPYFFAGRAAEGIGGPHEGLRMIWPMSIIMRALTSDDDAEIRQCLGWLKKSHAGRGFMHESFDQDDPGRFTRPWFAWVNGLFGELIIDLLGRKPDLLH